MLRSFGKIYSEGTLPMSPSQSDEGPPSGPKVEDLGDGTARIEIDQVLPWSVVMQILDLMAETAPDEPQRLS